MSPISASTFKLASGHFLVWRLHHLIWLQQVHPCSGALLPFLDGAMASVIVHPSSQLLIDFGKFSSPLVSSLQKSAPVAVSSKSTPLSMTCKLFHTLLAFIRSSLLAFTNVTHCGLCFLLFPQPLPFIMWNSVALCLPCLNLSLESFTWIFSVLKIWTSYFFKAWFFFFFETSWLVWDVDLLHC